MERLDPERVPLSGTTVIEASAGTGKTYTITSLFLRLVLERGLEVRQILVVTYTRAATAELRQRIRGRLVLAHRIAQGERVNDPLLERLCAQVKERAGEAALREQLDRALASIDEAPVFTIHGFCQRVLSEHAFESGARLDTELTTHTGPILAEIADDYFTGQLYAAEPETAQNLLKEADPLRGLAVRALSSDGMRVLPEDATPIFFDPEAWRAAHARCAEIWRREREMIVALLTSLKSVGRYLPGYAENMDRALAMGVPGCTEGFSEACRQIFTRTGAHSRVKKGQVPPEHAFLDAAETFMALEETYRRATLGERLRFRRRFVDYLRVQLNRRSRTGELRTFDGLLRELDGALAGDAGETLAQALRRRYGAALVDEFQDTDPLQYRIFRRLFGGTRTPLFLIGDPKQAIYGFRGADVHAYLAARRDAGDRVYTLDTNHRSDPSLIAALNGWYASMHNPFALEQIAYRPVLARTGVGDLLRHEPGAGALELLLLDDPAQGEALRTAVTRAVAADVARLLASKTELARPERGPRQVSPLDIAILCRKNKQALALQQALSELGVPSVFQGDASVFESDDAAELERALEALAHPASVQAVRSFLCSWYGGCDAHELLALEADDADWEKHRATFSALHETWLSHGFMQAFRGLVLEYAVEERLLRRPDGTRRVTNLWHLAELLTEASITQRLGPLGLLRWYRIVRQDEARRAELVGEDHELRLESGDDAVQLTTIHKSKGLEYPIVYCPFLWESTDLRRDDAEFVRFHDPGADYALTLDLGSEAHAEHKALAAQENLAEALRLFYVALTRAKHRVCVLVPNAKALAKSALGHALSGPGGQAPQRADLPPEELLRELVDGLGGTAALRVLREAGEAVPYSPLRRHASKLMARTSRRQLDQATRVSSFSGLISGQKAVPQVVLGLDHDAEPQVPEAPPREVSSPLLLDGFPRGAAAGQLVHEVLEQLDFCASEEERAQVTHSLLSARGYPTELADKLAQGLDQVLSTPLDESGLRLSFLTRDARRDEMEFTVPVESALTPRVLERLFREHRAPAALPSYAGALRELGFEALKGFLRGFIDLVFSYRGRFYIVDYKSNHLGARPEHYEQEALAQSMAEHHYYLQYHLYSLALHRHLNLRVRNYDYDTHFGGVYYLFLRGMSPAHATGTGVFFDRPSAALIRALDHALSEATERAETP